MPLIIANSHYIHFAKTRNRHHKNNDAFEIVYFSPFAALQFQFEMLFIKI